MESSNSAELSLSTALPNSLLLLCKHTKSDATSANSQSTMMLLLDHPTLCTRDRYGAVSTPRVCADACKVFPFALANDSTLLGNELHLCYFVPQ